MRLCVISSNSENDITETTPSPKPSAIPARTNSISRPRTSQDIINLMENKKKEDIPSPSTRNSVPNQKSVPLFEKNSVDASYEVEK